MFLFSTLLTHHHDPSPRSTFTPQAPKPVKYLSTSGYYHRSRMKKKCPARAILYRRTPRREHNNISLVFLRSYRFFLISTFAATNCYFIPQRLSSTPHIGIMRFSKFKAFAVTTDDQADIVDYHLEFGPFSAPLQPQVELPPPPYCQPCSPPRTGDPITPRLHSFHISDADASQLHEQQEEATDNRNPRADAYWWHCRPGDLPLAQLNLLAGTRLLPATILPVTQTPCATRIFGKLTRRSWTKGASRPTFSATKPGEGVSVDQPQSSTPGCVPYSKGIFTNNRYTVSTIFVCDACYFICLLCFSLSRSFSPAICQIRDRNCRRRSSGSVFYKYKNH